MERNIRQQEGTRVGNVNQISQKDQELNFYYKFNAYIVYQCDIQTFTVCNIYSHFVKTGGRVRLWCKVRTY